ncbi:hypothetical protein WJX79_007115 [Trebouxia sp. C0005]
MNQLRRVGSAANFAMFRQVASLQTSAQPCTPVQRTANAAGKEQPTAKSQPRIPGWVASVATCGAAAGVYTFNSEAVPLTGRRQLLFRWPQASTAQPNTMCPPTDLESYRHHIADDKVSSPLQQQAMQLVKSLYWQAGYGIQLLAHHHPELQQRLSSLPKAVRLDYNVYDLSPQASFETENHLSWLLASEDKYARSSIPQDQADTLASLQKLFPEVQLPEDDIEDSQGLTAFVTTMQPHLDSATDEEHFRAQLQIFLLHLFVAGRRAYFHNDFEAMISTHPCWLERISYLKSCSTLEQMASVNAAAYSQIAANHLDLAKQLEEYQASSVWPLLVDFLEPKLQGSKDDYQKCMSIKSSHRCQIPETLRQHASQQAPLQLAQYTVLSSVQVNLSSLKELFYVPAFLTREEEVQLLQAVDAAPAARWTHAGERQMQNWGGRPGEAVIREKLPQFLQALVELLLAAGVYPLEQAPQHVLINSYSKAAGISPHMDGPLYAPCVATITLGGPALMAFHELQPDGTQGPLATEVMLQPRCLLLMRGPVCSSHTHSIPSQDADVISESCGNLDAAHVHAGTLKI